jgi:spermidine synthase
MPGMEAMPHRLIHRAHDGEGLLEVVEDSATRTLYFGSRAKQSSMLLCHPQVLVLSYTQAMTTALLFQPQPRSVLTIGLGGGSLAKFFHYHFPDCSVLAVESRTAVVDIARDYFELPQDERMRVHAGSALDYFAQPARETFDLVFVDIFNATGMDVELEESGFFAHCRERLTEGGVLIANLWATRPGACRQHLKQLRSSFDGQVLELPAPDCGNLIAFGLSQAFPASRLADLGAAAEELFQRVGIDYPDFLDRMRRRNRFLLRRLFR